MTRTRTPLPTVAALVVAIAATLFLVVNAAA